MPCKWLEIKGFTIWYILVYFFKTYTSVAKLNFATDVYFLTIYLLGQRTK